MDFVAGVTTNIPRGAIRAQTPPSVTNISSAAGGYGKTVATVISGGYGKTVAALPSSAIPPRTPSPAGIQTATTWMAGNQPVQLIRASIGHSPRTRIVSQSVPASVTAVSNATISANIVSSQSGGGASTIQNVSQQQSNQNVSSGNQPSNFLFL